MINPLFAFVEFTCGGCRRAFMADPRFVPVLRHGPDGERDIPVCSRCVVTINNSRIANGRQPLWQGEHRAN